VICFADRDPDHRHLFDVLPLFPPISQENIRGYLETTPDDSWLVFDAGSDIKPAGNTRSKLLRAYFGNPPREQCLSARLREFKGEPYDSHFEKRRCRVFFLAAFGHGLGPGRRRNW